MGVFSKLEGGLDNAFDKAAGAVFRGPIEPAQIAKRAEKQMNREKLVGAGKQYAPTLYTVLVNEKDDRKLFAFYPTMAAEIETFLMGKGTQNGLKFDGRPLVRFIVDRKLKSGKFDVIAENVAAPIIAQLREEELEYYGIKKPLGPPRIAAPADNLLPLDTVEPGIAGASTILPAAGSLRDSLKNQLPSIADTPRAPAVLGKACLVDMNAGKSYALNKSPFTIGRGSSCDIAIHDANISRNHAELTQDATGTWKISDLGSTNGTRVNNSSVNTALLRRGDTITLGVTVLEFRDS